MYFKENMNCQGEWVSEGKTSGILDGQNTKINPTN